MRRRRRRKRNPASDRSARAIAWTIGITALTAATGAIVVYFVNKHLEKPEPKPALDVEVSGQWPDNFRKWFQPGSQVA